MQGPAAQWTLRVFDFDQNQIPPAADYPHLVAVGGPARVSVDGEVHTLGELDALIDLPASATLRVLSGAVAAVCRI